MEIGITSFAISRAGQSWGRRQRMTRKDTERFQVRRSFLRLFTKTHIPGIRPCPCAGSGYRPSPPLPSPPLGWEAGGWSWAGGSERGDGAVVTSGSRWEGAGIAALIPGQAPRRWLRKHSRRGALRSRPGWESRCWWGRLLPASPRCGGSRPCPSPPDPSHALRPGPLEATPGNASTSPNGPAFPPSLEDMGKDPTQSARVPLPGHCPGPQPPRCVGRRSVYTPCRRTPQRAAQRRPHTVPGPPRPFRDAASRLGVSWLLRGGMSIAGRRKTHPPLLQRVALPAPGPARPPPHPPATLHRQWASLAPQTGMASPATP